MKVKFIKGEFFMFEITEDNKRDIDILLIDAVSKGASDIHLKIGEPPVYRINGRILRTDKPIVTEAILGKLIEEIIPERIEAQSRSEYDLDFSYEIVGLSRFRINLNRQTGHSGLVIRAIPYDMLDYKKLNLPPAIKKLTEFNNGLIFLTGPTGCGKSTTLAAMLDSINKTQEKHIITIEEPIEYMYKPEKSIITQRQIGLDTPSFLEGLKHALRQDPDVILIGEIRDKLTMDTALKAAETGHLVLSTLHTTNAIQTINRVIGFFEPVEREEVRKQLASALRATIAQKLVPTKDGLNRVPVCEILVSNSTVAGLIEDDKIDDIYALAEHGSFGDIMVFNKTLFDLVKKGIISNEVAMQASDNKNELHQLLRGAFRGTQDFINPDI